MTEPISWVYFIQAGDDGPIKIGVTSGSPVDRMRRLQTGSSTRFRLLCTIRGDRTVERRLHQLFAQARIRGDGEWFHPISDLKMFIGGVLAGRESEQECTVASASIFAAALAVFINAICEYTKELDRHGPLPEDVISIGREAFECGGMARRHVDDIPGAVDAAAVLDAAMEPLMRGRT
jgi:hypothetical protein